MHIISVKLQNLLYIIYFQLLIRLLSWNDDAY